MTIETNTNIETVAHAHQVFGYWFQPSEEIPAYPPPRRPSAVLPRSRGTFAACQPGTTQECLELMCIRNYWIPLSEAVLSIYRHLRDMSDETSWSFVPAPNLYANDWRDGDPVHSGIWPVRFAVIHGESLDKQKIESFYGTDVAARTDVKQSNCS